MGKRVRLNIVHLVLMVAVLAAIPGPMFSDHQQAAEAQGQGLKWKLSKGSGPAGKTITAFSQGGGWEEGSTVVVEGRIKGSKKTLTLCQTEVKDNGQWSCKITIPKSADGKVSITVSGSQIISATTQVFNVTEDDKGGNDKGGSDNNRRGNGGRENNLVPIPPPPAIQGPAQECDSQPGGCEEVARKINLGRLIFLCLTDPNTILGCRALINQWDRTTALPPDAEMVLTQLECVNQITDLKSGRKVSLLLELIRLGLTDCQALLPLRDTPLPQPPLEIAPSIPLPECIPGQTGVVIECAENPSEQFRPEPLPVVPPVAPEDLPTFGNVLDSLESPPAAPSASLVQEQHDEIRAGVCANVPAGAGGCP